MRGALAVTGPRPAHALILWSMPVNSDANRARQRIHPGWRFAARSGSGAGRGFLRVWLVWERIMRLFEPAQAAPGAPFALFIGHVRRYRGRGVLLPDGTMLTRGDRIIELHINNRAVTAFMRTGTMWDLLRALRADLAAIAAWVAHTPTLADIRALHGESLLGRAAPRLGFIVLPPRKNPYTWLNRFYFSGIIVIYHPHGLARLAQGHTRHTYPQEVWMSRRALRARYGPVPEASPDVASEIG
jgi:hypothetical protein